MGIEFISGGVCAPKGFKAAGIHCGIRKNRLKPDLGMIVSDVPCTAAGVYTQNKVKGAPIFVTKEHLKDNTARAVLVNSGNANTCNADGVEVANAMCESAAQALGIAAQDMIIASTGVIGQPLPLGPITSSMEKLVGSLSYEGSSKAAEAMLTTDLIKKEGAVEITLGGVPVRIGAIAKGSGMLQPNMATMLCFICSDAAIGADMLKKALKAAVDDTLNMVSVDGDTSTNDTCAILCNGLAGNREITAEDEDYTVFAAALKSLLIKLTRELARDGEGATKLIEVNLSGAPDTATAKKIAKSVINSMLFKSAIFGCDANWGRILCAIGYTDAAFDIDKTDVYLESLAGKIQVCENGHGVAFSEEFAREILLRDEITVDIQLNQGDGKATAWGCDLTYDYVKINGEYRT